MNIDILDHIVTAYGDTYERQMSEIGAEQVVGPDGKPIIYISTRHIYAALIFGRLRVQKLMAANEELRRFIE